MTPRLVRWVVLGICAAGIAGMIVASVAGSQETALTFGLITAGAIACLIVATAVAGPAEGAGGVDEARAARVEQLVDELAAAGADETTLRELVREASHLRR